jgi:hypothetical protein
MPTPEKTKHINLRRWESEWKVLIDPELLSYTSTRYNALHIKPQNYNNYK